MNEAYRAAAKVNKVVRGQLFQYVRFFITVSLFIFADIVVPWLFHGVHPPFEPMFLPLLFVIPAATFIFGRHTGLSVGIITVPIIYMTDFALLPRTVVEAATFYEVLSCIFYTSLAFAVIVSLLYAIVIAMWRPQSLSFFFLPQVKVAAWFCGMRRTWNGPVVARYI